MSDAKRHVYSQQIDGKQQKIPHRGLYSNWHTRGSTTPGAESDIYDCLVIRVNTCSIPFGRSSAVQEWTWRRWFPRDWGPVSQDGCIGVCGTVRWTVHPRPGLLAPLHAPAAIITTTSTSLCLASSVSVNAKLPEFAAERRRLQRGARSYQSISPARRTLSSKPAGRRCCCR